LKEDILKKNRLLQVEIFSKKNIIDSLISKPSSQAIRPSKSALQESARRIFSNSKYILKIPVR
jgi:hypothetical protein